MEKQVNELGGCSSDILSGTINADNSLLESKKCYHGKQLLQFDKSHRPAFYGIWPQKRLVPFWISTNDAFHVQLYHVCKSALV